MSECFICKNPNSEEIGIGATRMYVYRCPFCGEYGLDEDIRNGISGRGINYVENGKNKLITVEEFYSKAPSIAAERKLKVMDGYLLVFDSDLSSWQNNTSNSFAPIGIKAFLREYPKDAIDMFNRVLLNLGRLITHPSEKFRFEHQTTENGIYSFFYSHDASSASSILQQLEGLGWTESRSYNTQCFNISLTPKGWLALRELKPSEDSDRAFLAMWFSKEDKQLGMLRNAIKDAVTQAGYICDVVDEIHHNDYIMDKVLNLIKDSRFVIADFTFAKEGDIGVNGKILGGVRGGVYYEAGFAKGLGRPVIVSCRKDNDSEARIHFDIAQLSTIFWQQDGDKLTTNGLDFIEFMKERIIATVGKGKHYKER